MVSEWAGGLVSERLEKACAGCISETLMCKLLILGRDIGWGVGEQCHGVTLILPLTLLWCSGPLKSCPGNISEILVWSLSWKL